MPGEKIGEGYVEVTVDIDDGLTKTATEKIARDVDDGLTREAPGIGKHFGDGIGEGVGPSGDKAAKTWLDNFKAHQGDFSAFAKGMGDDFYKSFEGDQEAALGRINQLFEEKLSAGGFDAANKFSEQFNSRVKTSFENSNISGSLADNIEKNGPRLLTFADSLGKDFWNRFNGNAPAGLDELNRLFNEKSSAGGFSASSLFMDAFNKRLGENNSNNSTGFFKLAETWGTDAAREGVKIGDMFSNGIVGGLESAFKLFSSLPPEAQGAIAGAAAAAAAIFGTLLLAALDAAFLGLAGGVGLAAAIASQITSPMVDQAWQYFEQTAKDTFEQAGHGLEKPIAEALNTLRADLNAAAPDIQRWFNGIAPALQNLAAAVGHAFEELMHAFADSSDAQRAALDGLAQAVEILGHSFALFFEEIKGGGKGAAEALQAVAMILGSTIVGLGQFIEVGSQGFADFEVVVRGLFVPLLALINVLGAAHVIPKSWVDDANKAYASFGNIPKNAKAAGDSVDDYGKSAGSAADATADLSNKMNDLTDAFSAMAGNGVAADQAAISFRNSLKDLQGTAKSGTKDMSMTNDQTVDLRNHFDQAASAALASANAIRQAAQAQGKDGVAASKAYDNALSGNIQQLVNTANAAGLNRNQVIDMISAMFQIPKSLVTQFYTPGGAAAQNLIDWLNANVHDRYMMIHVGYKVTSNQQLPPGFGAVDPGALGMVKRFDTGGIDQSRAGVYANGPILMFAEPSTGGEAFVPKNTPDPMRAEQVLAEAASWYHLSLVPSGGSSSSPSTTAPGTGMPAPSSAGGGGRNVTLNYYGSRPDPSTRFSLRRDLDLAVA